MAFAETSFLTGFVVPALPTIMTACLLALEGYFGVGVVALAAGLGGGLGDSCGFWIGRRGGRRLLRGEGRLREVARVQERRVNALMARHSGFAVTVGRLISFVRTLMPLVAGMSDLSYRRFLVYDALGVALWMTGSVLIGVGAGVGWQRIRDELGPAWAAGALVLGLLVWILLKALRARTVAVSLEGDV